MRQGPALFMCSVTGVVLAVSLGRSTHVGGVASPPPAASGVLLAPSPTALSRAPRRPRARATATPTPTHRTVRSSPSPAAQATRSPSPRPRPRPSPTRAQSVVVNGQAVDTRYGLVQVQITVRSHRITKADAIDYPQGSNQDQQINSYAIPQLDDETLQAQSAQIDTVSGATYTSDGYRQSLQSALDSAHAAGVW